MSLELKDWLVRTRTGEILGPFSEQEMLDELAAKSFSPDDEIAPTGGQAWISASLLQNRDKEEFTNTSTRNTSTRSFNSDAEPLGLSSAPRSLRKNSDRLTPMADADADADAGPREAGSRPVKSKQKPKEHRPSSNPKPLIVPIISAIIISSLVVTFFFKFNPRASDVRATMSINPAVTDAESDFTRTIYRLIQSGETGSALKGLTEYHEKAVKKESLDYLIPYAALLIMEGESLPRAKKFLEQLIAGQVSPRLKSRAHHWLGYLMLSQDEGDMGEGHFLESLQLNPKDAAARFNLGRSYLKQDKYSQALDYLQLAELETPDLWLVHIYKGRAKVALGQLDEARQSFKTALEQAPDRWLSHIYYSLFLVGIRSHAEARTVLKSMLTRDPAYEIHAPPPFGFFQERLNYTEYLSAYNHVMEKAPLEEIELGKIYLGYLMNGGSDEDIRKLEVLAKNGSLTANVLALKVALERKLKKEDLATRLASLPQNLTLFGPYGYVLRGEAKLRSGDTPGAKEDFQHALKLEPRSAIAHWALAGVLERQSQRKDARNAIERLLAAHPNYIPAVLSSQHY